MSVYTETKILDALIAQLNGITFSPALPIQWPGIDLDPPKTGAWLRVTFLPATSVVGTLSEAGENEHTGLFQIDAMTPINTGDIAAREIAGRIALEFKRGTVIAGDSISVRILTPPSILGGAQFSDRPFWMVPVRVTYIVYASNP